MKLDLSKFDFKDPSGMAAALWITGWVVYMHVLLPQALWAMHRFQTFDPSQPWSALVDALPPSDMPAMFEGPLPLSAFHDSK